MKKRIDFSGTFPLFAKYITNEIERNKLLENDELILKYNTYINTLSIFIFELEKNYDSEFINRIIYDVIINTDKDSMLKIITTYLNSVNEIKHNKAFIKMIIEKTIPQDKEKISVQKLDDEYIKLRSGVEQFKDKKIQDIYPTLDNNQKYLVIKLMQNKSLIILNEIFASISISFVSLLNLLLRLGINEIIINPFVVSKISLHLLTVLVLKLIELDNANVITQNINCLINCERFDLLKQLIIDDNISILASFNIENLFVISDEDILKSSRLSKILQTRKD